MKIRALGTLAFVLGLSGCTLDRYRMAEPSYTGTQAAASEASAIVLLEPVFPGKPFVEVVCDNTIGVMWSPEESRQIGFTQHYANTLAKNPQLLMLAALPANQRIGMSASGDIQPLNIDSRIMVPYGRFITSNLEQLLKNAGTTGVVCQDQGCVDLARQEMPRHALVTVRFTALRVAEEQRNMLTLEVVGIATVTKRDGTRREVPIRSLVNRSLTSEGLWHSNLLTAMNKIANESSSAVATQIHSAGL